MTQTINFVNESGHNLSARLDVPIDQHAGAYAVFAHCFTCNKNLTAIRQISNALTARGFGVLRFDFAGLGESEGDFEDTNFSGNIQDLLSVCRYMEKNMQAPKLLIGHSLGGAAVLHAAGLMPSVVAVATIAAPSNPAHVQQLITTSVAEIDATGRAEVNIGGRPFTITKQFLNDLANQDSKETIGALGKALLIMHSPQDSIVSIDNAADIYLAAKHPKSFVALDGADHLVSDKNDSRYAGDIIAAWAARYVTFLNKNELKPTKRVMVQTGAEGYTSQVRAGNHSYIADEPVSLGGNDLGPTPYDYLLTALGACTGMTLRMYADRKGWKVEEINVHLDHRHDHAEDCSHCEDPNAKIDHIDRWIEIKGDLKDDQMKRMLEIADKCPVHKTLEAKVVVSTKLVNT